MKRIAVVSNSPDSIEQITCISAKILGVEAIKFVPLLYHDLNDLNDFFSQHRTNIDGWIFSGETPYAFLSSNFDDVTHAVYCAHTGTDIYRYFLHALYRSQRHELRVSVDFPSTSIEQYHAILAETDVPTDNVHLFTYTPETLDATYQDIIRRHLSLWKDGLIDCTFTSSKKIYQGLLEEGVHVVQMRSNQLEIRQAALLLHAKLMRQRIRNSQVAILRLELLNPEPFLSAPDGSFRLQITNLKIKEHVLYLCQKMIGCYLAEKDNICYEIFASRHTIESHLEEVNTALQVIRRTLDMDMIGGIGYGEAASRAQSNARRAIAHGRSQLPAHALTLIDADGTITENPGTDGSLSFSAVSDDPELLRRLEAVSVGIRNYHKIVSIARDMSRPFTSADIARQMQTTDRNARRILARLLDAKLIVCVGEEALSSRGRPTKQYALTEP
ncbi:hypothetical protein TAMA11512_24470 [Selenomonas sp. TAMA-11512]|uniref:hypothetical protein n=1 Tax=Selenomonas sp. TAMA-11512 TaxID=3095337 RepID=UPI003085D103|nr:hypothetical protein TAMA11512_24470 [Selenomonas sp. TAMA-11512]